MNQQIQRRQASALDRAKAALAHGAISEADCVAEGCAAAMAQYLDMRMPQPLLSITGRCGIPSMAPGITIQAHGCGWSNFAC